MSDSPDKPTQPAELESLRGELNRLARALDFKLDEAHSLERLGLVAQAVAHEINNLLSAVMGNADLALAADGVPDEVAQHLEEILTATRKAADLAGQLLAAGRPAPRGG